MEEELRKRLKKKKKRERKIRKGFKKFFFAPTMEKEPPTPTQQMLGVKPPSHIGEEPARNHRLVIGKSGIPN